MNKSYLPSKKFTRFITAIVALGVIIWVVSMMLSGKVKFKNNSENRDANVAKGEETLYTKDSDADGIYDWEEGLWGTDPNNKDTNGDGVSDADEIDAKKKDIREKNNLSGELVSDTKDLNQTEMFARQLFSTASLANQAGGLSPGSLDSFSQAFGKSISNSKVEDLYNLSDIKLSNITPSAYKSELAKIFSPYATSGIHAERTIYNLSAGDTSAKDDIEKLSKIYHDISNNLIASDAPYAEAGVHLALANATAKMSIALLNINKLNEDPILASTGLHQYETYLKEMENSFNSLQVYFSSNAIINR